MVHGWAPDGPYSHPDLRSITLSFAICVQWIIDRYLDNMVLKGTWAFLNQIAHIKQHHQTRPLMKTNSLPYPPLFFFVTRMPQLRGPSSLCRTFSPTPSLSFSHQYPLPISQSPTLKIQTPEPVVRRCGLEIAQSMEP